MKVKNAILIFVSVILLSSCFLLPEYLNTPDWLRGVWQDIPVGTLPPQRPRHTWYVWENDAHYISDQGDIWFKDMINSPGVECSEIYEGNQYIISIDNNGINTYYGFTNYNNTVDPDEIIFEKTRMDPIHLYKWDD